MARLITAPDLCRFTQARPLVLFEMKIAGKDLVSRYVRSKSKVIRKNHIVISYIDRVIAYDVELLSSGKVTQLLHAVVDIWPIDSILQPALWALAGGHGNSSHPGSMLEAVFWAIQQSPRHIADVVTRAKDRRESFKRAAYLELSDAAKREQIRKWLLLEQEPPRVSNAIPA